MQTHFSPLQLADPGIASANAILRACVHCGLCTATCPTYVLLGDELDGPRGRIYQIKQMLEGGGVPTANTVKHLDRCLSCQSCMTSCPSGVHYAHLIDDARARIATHYRRPWGERLLRGLLLRLLTSRRALRLALRLARGLRPFARWAPRQLAPILELGAAQRPRAGGNSAQSSYAAQGQRQQRVALLGGCAQGVLAPQINDCAVRLLNRNGVEVVMLSQAHCCGALAHHLGDTRTAQRQARAVMDGWRREIESRGLDAIVMTASGCGTMIKDYGFIFRNDPDWAGCASRIAALARDIVEVLPVQPGDSERTSGVRVAYHSACSLQHGQRIDERPRELLRAAGFDVQEVPEGHLCCGSAGTYNLLQPELARQLRERKVAAIRRVAPDVIAAGNLGCLTQIAAGADVPAVHTVELLDWAGGGPLPEILRSMTRAQCIYHLCLRTEWESAVQFGRYEGSSQDRTDGFIHFSTAEQLPKSARKHRLGQRGLVLLAVDPHVLGEALRWEPSRRGALFPHLYGALPVSAVRSVNDAPLDSEGMPALPGHCTVEG